MLFVCEFKEISQFLFLCDKSILIELNVNFFQLV